MLEFDYVHIQTQLYSPRITKGSNGHEDTPLRVTHGAKPSNVLWVSANVVMSRYYMSINYALFTYDGRRRPTSCRASVNDRNRDGLVRLVQYMWAKVARTISFTVLRCEPVISCFCTRKRCGLHDAVTSLLVLSVSYSFDELTTGVGPSSRTRRSGTGEWERVRLSSRGVPADPFKGRPWVLLLSFGSAETTGDGVAISEVLGSRTIGSATALTLL